MIPDYSFMQYTTEEAPGKTVLKWCDSWKHKLVIKMICISYGLIVTNLILNEVKYFVNFLPLH